MKQHRTAYPPLELLEQINATLCGLEGLKQAARELDMSFPEDMDDAAFVRYCCDLRMFQQDGAPEPYASVNALLMKLGPKLIPLSTMQKIHREHMSIRHKMREILLPPSLFRLWGRNKQVYKPDPSFADAPIRTAHLELTRDLLTHLRANPVYLDLSGCSDFAPAVGALVHVEVYETDAFLTVFLLDESDTYSMLFCGGTFDEHGILMIQTEDVPLFPKEEEYDVPLPKPLETGAGISRQRIATFALQALCYLGSKEPEITASPLTSKTYRKPKPGSTPKNRWSEVEIHDVGVRYGTAVRTFLAHQAEASLKADPSAHGHHRSPRAHFRSAHRQRYWTGTGRTVCVVKWIAPIFVGANGQETAMDTVIHRLNPPIETE